VINCMIATVSARNRAIRSSVRQPEALCPTVNNLILAAQCCRQSNGQDGAAGGAEAAIGLRGAARDEPTHDEARRTGTLCNERVFAIGLAHVTSAGTTPRARAEVLP
jgi:hypothetical protein